MIVSIGNRTTQRLYILPFGFLIIILIGYHFSDRISHFARTNGRDLRIISSDDLLEYQNGWRDFSDVDFLAYIGNHWLVGPSTAEYKLGKVKEHYSQAGQSQFVDDVLRQKTGGFFIEAGAADGERLSNTLFFERIRGWTGLLVEANPGLYTSLLNKRRKAYSINACLNAKNVSGLLRFELDDLRGGLDSTMDASHRKWVETHKPTPVLVQCFPLHAMLNALGVTRVDYFSLDVEGPEVEILYTLPLGRIYFDVFSIEYRVSDGQKMVEDQSLEKLKRIREFFQATGLYREIGILSEWKQRSKEKQDAHGLDVIFKRI